MIPASEWIVTGLLRASVGLSIAALMVAACVRLLRLRAPRAEQWAWLFVLAQGVIVLPVSIPIPSRFGERGASPRRVETAASPIEPARSPDEAKHGVSGREPAVFRPPVAAPWPEPATVRRGTDIFPFSWAVAAFAAWLMGLVMLLGIGVLRYGIFAGRLRGARPAAPEWQAEWRRVLDDQAIRTPISLVVSREAGPALCWLPSGYCLVVPESLWAALETTERALILRHELAHYRRGDLWTTLLARCLAVFQWFNPLAWWAVARFEAQTEFICDRTSAAADPMAFAETLLRLGSVQGARIAIVRAARSGSLFERIQRLIGDSPRPARWKCALPVAVAILALGPSAVRLQAVGVLAATDERLSDPAAESPLPLRALLRIGTDDLRTRREISAIAFSPDGKLVAAGNSNAWSPIVTLFDVRTGRQAKQIRVPEKSGNAAGHIAFSPDGTKLLWGDHNGRVSLWDLTKERLLFSEKIHGGGGVVNGVLEDITAYMGSINDVAFSPDGTIMASVSVDGAVQLRRVEKPTEVVREFKTPVSPSGRRASRAAGMMGGGAGGGRRRGPDTEPGLESARRVAFTPDGTRLIVGSGDGGSTSISIWRINDGQFLRRIERVHGNREERSTAGSLSSLAVTPDGRRIMSAGDRTVPIAQTQLKNGFSNVTLTEIRFWDIETGECLMDRTGDEDYGFGSAALSRDGRRVAVADYGALRIFRADTGQPELTIMLPGCRSDQVAFSPDGMLVARPMHNAIALFDVRTGQRLRHDERTPVGETSSAAWSPSGDRIVTGHNDGVVRVWEAKSGRLLWHKEPFPVLGPHDRNIIPAFVTFSRDGRRVVVAGGRDMTNGIVAIYDATRGLLVREVHPRELHYAALSPDRAILVVAAERGGFNVTQLQAIEVETGRTLWAAPSDGVRTAFFQLRAIQFRPDSASLDVAIGNGDVIRYDALTGKEQRRFVADARPAEQRKPVRPGGVLQLLWLGAFSEDDHTLVSYVDQLVHVWDVDTGKLRRTISHPHGPQCFMGLSPDGKALAMSDRLYAGEHGEDTVRLYDVETGEPLLTLAPIDDRAAVLAFSPDGTKLFTGFHRGSAMVWDVRRPKSEATTTQRRKP
jgi:WD40 repeat protein/beta-lactamase regulating signal transducer with metallopeptidase domain